MAGSDAATLLRKAEADLRAIAHMADTFAFDEGIFGFHAQQACEKALKVWLLSCGVTPPFSHDLRELFLLLREVGVQVPESAEIARLTKYAVQWRYGDPPYERLLDRPATVALCERLIAQVVPLVARAEGERD